MCKPICQSRLASCGSNRALQGGGRESLTVYRNLVWGSQSSASLTIPLWTTDLDPDTWTNAWVFTDDLIENDDSAGTVAQLGFTNQSSIGSVVDYNTYYAPNNSSGNIFYNASTKVSFATWQAGGWDTHGAVSNPGWSSPSALAVGHIE